MSSHRMGDYDQDHLIAFLNELENPSGRHHGDLSQASTKTEKKLSSHNGHNHNNSSQFQSTRDTNLSNSLPITHKTSGADHSKTRYAVEYDNELLNADADDNISDVFMDEEGILTDRFLQALRASDRALFESKKISATAAAGETKSTALDGDDVNINTDTIKQLQREFGERPAVTQHQDYRGSNRNLPHDHHVHFPLGESPDGDLLQETDGSDYFGAADDEYDLDVDADDDVVDDDYRDPRLCSSSRRRHQPHQPHQQQQDRPRNSQYSATIDYTIPSEGSGGGFRQGISTGTASAGSEPGFSAGNRQRGCGAKKIKSNAKRTTGLYSGSEQTNKEKKDHKAYKTNKLKKPHRFGTESDGGIRCSSAGVADGVSEKVKPAKPPVGQSKTLPKGAARCRHTQDPTLSTRSIPNNNTAASVHSSRFGGSATLLDELEFPRALGLDTTEVEVEAQAKVRSLELRLQGQLQTIRSLEAQLAESNQVLEARNRQLAHSNARWKHADQQLQQLKLSSKANDEATPVTATATNGGYAVGAAEKNKGGSSEQHSTSGSSAKISDAVRRYKAQAEAIQTRLLEEQQRRQKIEDRCKLLKTATEKAKERAAAADSASETYRKEVAEMSARMQKVKKTNKDLTAEVAAVNVILKEREKGGRQQQKNIEQLESTIRNLQMALEHSRVELRTQKSETQAAVAQVRNLQLQLDVLQQKQLTKQAQHRLDSITSPRSLASQPTEHHHQQHQLQQQQHHQKQTAAMRSSFSYENDSQRILAMQAAAERQLDADVVTANRLYQTVPEVYPTGSSSAASVSVSPSPPAPPTADMIHAATIPAPVPNPMFSIIRRSTAPPSKRNTSNTTKTTGLPRQEPPPPVVGIAPVGFKAFMDHDAADASLAEIGVTKGNSTTSQSSTGRHSSTKSDHGGAGAGVGDVDDDYQRSTSTSTSNSYNRSSSSNNHSSNSSSIARPQGWSPQNGESSVSISSTSTTATGGIQFGRLQALYDRVTNKVH